MSQPDLAHEMRKKGVRASGGDVSRIEGGHTKSPGLARIVALALVLEVPADYLLGLTDVTEPYPAPRPSDGDAEQAEKVRRATELVRGSTPPPQEPPQ